MTFYSPGFICVSEKEFEKYTNKKLPCYPTEEYLLLSTIFCFNDKFEITHTTRDYYHNVFEEDAYFKRAQELNRKAGNIRTFDTYYDFAVDWRHNCRRFAALAFPSTGTKSQIISNTPALLRMLAIYLSWPFDIKEPEDRLTGLFKYYVQISERKPGEIVTLGDPRVPYTGIYELKDLRHTYAALSPHHTRDTLKESAGYRKKLLCFSLGELLWEKFDQYGNISKQANKPIEERFKLDEESLKIDLPPNLF